MMELFSKIIYGALAVNSFPKKTQLWMLDWVLNTPQKFI